jgi:hypothetical protein
LPASSAYPFLPAIQSFLSALVLVSLWWFAATTSAQLSNDRRSPRWPACQNEMGIEDQGELNIGDVVLGTGWYKEASTPGDCFLALACNFLQPEEHNCAHNPLIIIIMLHVDCSSALHSCLDLLSFCLVASWTNPSPPHRSPTSNSVLEIQDGNFRFIVC